METGLEYRGSKVESGGWDSWEGQLAQLGSEGALLAFPTGSGAKPQPNLNLVHFSLKI